MPRKAPWPPPIYPRDGQDRVRIYIGPRNYRDIVLGPTGSEQSKREYARIIAELEAGARRQASPSITVAEIAAEFLEAHQGEDPRTLNHLRVALTPAVRLYGHCRACEFGPVALRTVREEWVKQEYCRFSVNRFAKIIRRWFRWCAGRELVSHATAEALSHVEPLRKGKTTAAERPKVKPASDAVDFTIAQFKHRRYN